MDRFIQTEIKDRSITCVWARERREFFLLLLKASVCVIKRRCNEKGQCPVVWPWRAVFVLREPLTCLEDWVWDYAVWPDQNTHSLPLGDWGVFSNEAMIHNFSTGSQICTFVSGHMLMQAPVELLSVGADNRFHRFVGPFGLFLGLFSVNWWSLNEIALSVCLCVLFLDQCGAVFRRLCSAGCQLPVGHHHHLPAQWRMWEEDLHPGWLHADGCR